MSLNTTQAVQEKSRRPTVDIREVPTTYCLRSMENQLGVSPWDGEHLSDRREERKVEQEVRLGEGEE